MQGEVNKRAIPKRKCRTEDRVIIRIWTSQYNQFIPGKDVGHISIETNNFYLSLWPTKDESDNLLKAMIEKRDPDFLKRYNEDEKKEERIPNFTVCLYSLNIDQMEEKFNELKKNVEFWTVLGNNRLWSKTAQHSCASSAYEILIAGGFLNLINASTFGAKFSSVVSPDQLQLAVEAAKRQELNEHPETKDFKYVSKSTLQPEGIVESAIRPEPISPNRYLIWTTCKKISTAVTTLGVIGLAVGTYYYSNNENNITNFKI